MPKSLQRAIVRKSMLRVTRDSTNRPSTNRQKSTDRKKTKLLSVVLDLWQLVPVYLPRTLIDETTRIHSLTITKSLLYRRFHQRKEVQHVASTQANRLRLYRRQSPLATHISSISGIDSSISCRRKMRNSCKKRWKETVLQTAPLSRRLIQLARS